MKYFAGKWWPLGISLFALLVITTYLILSVLNNNNGHFVYTQDDTYIHMGIAKNLSQNGSWGISPNSFSSCSSSLFWTSLIALIYYFTGLSELIPLLIGIICSISIVLFVGVLFNKEGIKPAISLFALLMLIYFIDLPYNIIMGLEHVLHALVNILFIYYGAEVLTGRKNARKDMFYLVVLAALMPLMRFEGLVSVLFLCLLMLFYKRFLLSISTLLIAALPVVIFGLISISNGWSFFPNSVLIKLNCPELHSFDDFLYMSKWIFGKIFGPSSIITMVLVILLLAAGAYYFRRYRLKLSRLFVRDIIITSFFAVNAVFYYAFSSSELAGRYQYFLVAMAFFLAVVLIFRDHKHESNKVKIAAIVIGLVVLLSSINFWEFDSYMKMNTTPTRTKNIYEQQYQMARFIKRFYNDAAVGLNDIGTTSYFTNAKITDFVGLGDYEPYKFRRGNYSKDDVRSLVKKRNVKLAIVYDGWLGEAGYNILPEEWTRVGQWKIENNVVCGSDVVSIYAVDEREKESLVENLKEFSGELPSSVQQSGLYTEIQTQAR